MYFEKLNSLYSEKCVYCGMCLEHCPTYAVTKNESESPRGRISLISALNNGDLEENIRSLTHINNCVLCLSCQKTCPANVNFQNIMETFRNKNFKNLSYKTKISLFINKVHMILKITLFKIKRL